MPKVRIDDSLEMYYEDDDFTDPWRSADTVVLHHGNAKNCRLWYAWVPLLSRQYRVVRPDARGYGQSTVPARGYSWSLGNFAHDLKVFLDSLGLEAVHLIGETVGGTISLQFAYQYPERVKSLTVCTSPYKFVGDPSFLESRDLVDRVGVEEWARSPIHQRLDPARSDAQHVEWYAQQQGKTAKHVVVETLTYLSGQDLSDILPEIQVPTLILVSENGHARTPEWADGMKSLIPNSRLTAIPGTSGYVQHSAPEQCVDVWREFVGGLRIASGS